MSLVVERAIAAARTTGELVIRRERLSRIPSEVRDLTGLRRLAITNCDLSELPEWIGELKSLEYADFADNPLRRLPRTLGGLSSLRVLGLSRTRLGAFDVGLRDLTALEVLMLPGAGIRGLPLWIEQLEHLRVLDLGGNGLETLPLTFAGLRRLTHLNMWGHRFREFPPVVCELAGLEALDISGRGTADLRDARSPNDALEEIDPVDNTTRLVGSDVGKHGHLVELPARLAEAFPVLRRLAAGGQRIGAIPATLPARLEELYLANNELSTMPPAILALQRLTALDLRGNRLVTVPAGLAALQTLRYLDLRDNPLQIPPEVIASGIDMPERIIDFVARAQGPTQRLDEAKLLVVGEGSVGKTSFVKRLVTGDFSEHEEKTEGIEVNRWSLQAGDAQIRLNIWDFGGQEIMHATHQFFLTKRSLYVLVIDARQGEEQNRIEYWLKLIQSFADASPVIIVGNKTEQSVLDIDARGLMTKYPNVLDIVSVSCKTGAGIAEVEQRLASAIDGMEHVRDALPVPFFDVKRELEQLDVDYLAYHDYERLCERHAIDDAPTRELLVGFLHDLGTVLCFRDDPRLSDTNILNPQWVTSGVYRLLNSHLAVAERKGLLTWSDFNEILDSVEYPTERRPFIVDVMKRFELCFESEGTFLVPDLLSKQEPDTGTWKDALRFEIQYDVLPQSVLSRLIVRMHPLISKRTMWRTGVVIAMDGNRALVKSDREDAVMRIAVDGPPSGRRGLLTAIRTQLKEIGQTIPGLMGEERVPVPDHPGVWVPYDHLLELEAANRRMVVPQGLTEDFVVRDLLAGVESPRASNASLHTVHGDSRGVLDAAGAAPWTPTEALRLARWLLVAIVVCVGVFVGANLAVGTAAAGGITGAALLAMVAIATLVLRSAGRISEQGMLAALRQVLAERG